MYVCCVCVLCCDEQKEDETGSSIAAAIGKIETDFHGHLEEMYVKMHTSTFKQMRRFYSLQREVPHRTASFTICLHVILFADSGVCSSQPMKWSVAAHAMASEVASNKTQG